MEVQCYCIIMLLGHYVIVLLCYCVIMLLQCYVITLSGYYTIAILQQNLFYIHTDYQYITVFIKQCIQPYYKIYILLYDTDLYVISVNQDAIVQYSIKLSILNI